MHCQICSSSESPSLLDMRGQFVVFKDQRMDLLSCFNLCKQIKIENEQNAKICESCQPKLIAEYLSKVVKSEANITDQQFTNPIQEIKEEPELIIGSEWIVENEKISDPEVKNEVAVHKSENQTDKAVSSYQIIFPVHEVKEEPELQIDDMESVESDQVIPTEVGVTTENANYLLDPEKHQKSNYSECSTALIFKCGICAKILKNRRNLSSHLLIHGVHKNCQCYQCLAIFETSRDLRNHMKKKHPEKILKCLYCVKVFKLKTNMLQHMDTHSDLKKYQCTDCSQAFNTKGKLLLHFQNIHSMMKFQCYKCSVIKPSKKGIRRHLLCHAEYIHKCSHCGKNFKSSRDLVVHQLSHVNTKNFKCSQCAAAFKTPYCLNRHVKNMHSPKTIKCLHCAKTFSSMFNLTQHMDAHSDSKKYPCKHCSEAFNTKSKVYLHCQNIHSMEKFQCHICSAMKKSRFLIKTHLMRHAEGKHRCPHCRKKIKTLKKLARHQLSHTN